jgi:hypothetical protein
MARAAVAAAVPALLAAALVVVEASAAAVPQFSAPVETFSGRLPFRVVAADLNADGNPDLATADHGSGSVSVMLGKGDAAFGGPSAIGRAHGRRMSRPPISAATAGSISSRPAVIGAAR